MGEQNTPMPPEMEKLEKKIVQLIMMGYVWSAKVTWKFLKFTGLWVAALILALDAGLKTVGVPGDIWGVPFLLSLVFAVGWTGWKFYQKSQAPPTESQAQAEPARGVFFGTGEQERTWWGGEKKGTIPSVTKPQNADGHVLVVGGAGSGKSSCIAIPTLRDGWHAAALVVDIKGELYEKSHRPRGLVFNPMSTSALGYDPFYLLSGSDNPIPEIREIALTLCPMEAGATKDPFWIQAAQNVLTGHLIFGWKSGASFIETIDVLQSIPIKKLLATEIKDTQAARYLMQFPGMEDRTLASIMVELSNKVVAFATDPHITAVLSKQDIITPELLEQGNDVFLQLPEYKLEQWKPMISLIVQQFSRHFEKRPDTGATPILFLLDEFARLGKMETVVHGLATLRSKHITIMPIIQSLAQLDATYGPDQRKIICDNCSYKAILGATDADSQSYFSKLVGTAEREKVTTSYEGTGWFAEAKGTSKTTEEKPIIKPEEFAYLKDIVLLTPQGFTRVQKKPYYLNESPALVHVQSTSMQLAQGAVPPQTRGNGHREPVFQAMLKPREVTSVPSQKPQNVPVAAPPLSKPGSQGNGAQQSEPEQFSPSAYAKRRQQEQATSTQGNGYTFQSQKQQPVTSSSTSALQEQHQQYEAALSILAKSAPAGTPLSAIALTFATKLPPEKQGDFLAWWQQHQNGKEEK